MFETQRVFQHSLYSSAALVETQDAYREFVEASFEHSSDSTTATFRADEENGAVIVDAFCNHALFLSIQAHRQDAGE